MLMRSRTQESMRIEPAEALRGQLLADVGHRGGGGLVGGLFGDAQGFPNLRIAAACRDEAGNLPRAVG